MPECPGRGRDSVLEADPRDGSPAKNLCTLRDRSAMINVLEKTANMGGRDGLSDGAGRWCYIATTRLTMGSEGEYMGRGFLTRRRRWRETHVALIDRKVEDTVGYVVERGWGLRGDR